jgi:hypothetical protein
MWDEASTQFSPHMLLTERTPTLKANNFLSPLVQTFEDDAKLSILVVEMIDMLQLIAKMHREVKENVCQA